VGPEAVHGLVDADQEITLLLNIIAATSTGPGVEPMAAAVARMIAAATASDVCFVHVLDDTDSSLTLAGATPPFDEQVGRIQLPLGAGVSGWVASHREPVVIVADKEADPRYMPIAALRGRDFTSMASVPMEAEPGGLVGVLNVHTISRRDFTARDIQLLEVSPWQFHRKVSPVRPQQLLQPPARCRGELWLCFLADCQDLTCGAPCRYRESRLLSPRGTCVPSQ
jgi:signal transduction protein with GAF and PtsI domain